MENEFAQDDGLLQEFVTESEDQLQRMEQDLLGIEKGSDPEIINRLFRAMHTIKGTSSFLGFDVLVELSHKAEDLLNAMRRGECSPTKSITDVLLLVCDQVRRMLADIVAHRPLHYDNTALIAQLEASRRNEPALPRLGEILTGQPVVAVDDLKDALHEAQRNGEKLGTVLVEKGLATSAQVEQALAKQGVAAEVSDQTTMRVAVRKLDSLVNLAGELVLERNRLVKLGRDYLAGGVQREDFGAALNESATRLSFITDELQSASLGTRMVPIESVFRRLPRMVREIAGSLGKRVDLEMSGQETEIDKTMVEQISDPLVHLVRNALDHGIEAPEARTFAGKPEAGTLSVKAHTQGDQIVISVHDDGKGIDPERILTKAVEKGFITEERTRSLSRREAMELIFLPGMSTAERVNNVSGRGVGMDVVRSNIKKLNGTVELESSAGSGTTVRMRVPLTMAILPVLLVEVGPEIYAIPLRYVQETVRVDRSQIHLVEGRELLCLPDMRVPLVRLESVLGVTNVSSDRRVTRAVVVTIGDTRVALLVDRLIGQEATVIKSMGNFLHECPGVAGATISGDGRVRLVLDPSSIISSCPEGTSHS